MLKKKIWLTISQIKELIDIVIYQGETGVDKYLSTLNLSRPEKSKVKMAILEASGRDLNNLRSGKMLLSETYQKYLVRMKSNKEMLLKEKVLVREINLIIEEGDDWNILLSLRGERNSFYQGILVLLIRLSKINIIEYKLLYAVFLHLKKKSRFIVDNLPEDILNYVTKHDVSTILVETLKNNPETVNIKPLPYRRIS